jgi:putative hydrolase of the HAD superfamily
MLKPDVRIYQAFLDKYGLKGEECLFIDDRADNIAGAKEAGLNTFQFMGDHNEVIRQLSI